MLRLPKYPGTRRALQEEFFDRKKPLSGFFLFLNIIMLDIYLFVYWKERRKLL